MTIETYPLSRLRKKSKHPFYLPFSYRSQKKNTPQKKNDSGNTLLHVAAKKGNLPIITYLLDQLEIDVNLKNSHQDTALHLAVKHHKQKAIQILLSHGAKRNETNNADQTPLDIAIENRNTTAIYLLLFWEPFST